MAKGGELVLLENDGRLDHSFVISFVHFPPRRSIRQLIELSDGASTVLQSVIYRIVQKAWVEAECFQRCLRFRGFFVRSTALNRVLNESLGNGVLPCMFDC